ncbi:MAG TPA: hypothetical protein VK929_07215 [Longimicrobiales bacterium]|nr:hypothetical protein [Longimicrobiales bacterium]
MKVSRSHGLAAVLAAGALCALAQPGAAQQMSVMLLNGSTDIPEISSAGGWAVSMGFAAGDLLRLEAGIHHRRQNSHLDTNVCISYEQMVGCRVEATRREAYLRGFGVGAALPIRPVPSLSIELGTGITLNQVRADDRTASGRANALFTRPTGQWGLAVGATARLRPVPTLPVSLHAGIGNHWIRMTSCGQYDWDESPFCGTASIRDLSAGLSFDLGGVRR